MTLADTRTATAAIRKGHTIIPTPPETADATIPAALYRLMTWLSPAFPVGGYAYSHGLEQAVETGDVRNAGEARAWIEDILAHGAGRNDAVLLVQAHAASIAGDGAGDAARLAEVAAIAAALPMAAELALESTAQGRAFLDTAQKTWDCPELARLCDCWRGPTAHAVAVGVAAAGHAIAPRLAAQAYVHAFAANLVSAAVRLVPLGQTDGQRILAALEPLVGRVVGEALCATLDDLGGATAAGDICAMRHETQYTRLFRS